MKRRPLRHRPLRSERLEVRTLLAAQGLVPLSGDFDADGVTETALFDAANSRFLLRLENNPGFPTQIVEVPNLSPGAIPLAGDFNGDGRDTLGVFEPANQQFRLLQANTTGAAETVFATPGFSAQHIPLAGDFNGNGRDTPALWDAAALRFYMTPSLATPLSEVPAFFPAHVQPRTSFANWQPIAGDWNGNGLDTLGVIEQLTGAIYLQSTLGTPTVEAAFQLSGVGSEVRPVVGDWNANGTDSIGFFQADTHSFALKNQLMTGGFDTEFYVVPQTSATIGASTQTEGFRATQSNLALDLIAWTDPGPQRFGATDVSGDGIVSLHDALLVVYVLRESMHGLPAEGEMLLRADVSGDGLVSLHDALLIVQELRVARIAETNLRTVNHSEAEPAALVSLLSHTIDTNKVLLIGEVDQLLRRAVAASASEDAIITIVDREGRILGVRVEEGVLDMYDANNNGAIDPGTAEERLLVFAIDGSLAKARTAAFFANGDGSGGVGPLTSRTVRFISQSTVTQRELESNPNIQDLNSPLRGPGFVAPAGLGGHFPPDVANTPPVDLFAIEHQSRDSILHPGPDMLKGTADDIPLASRFNVNPIYIPMYQDLEAPESYGFESGRMPGAQSRGIATLPGGLPIYKTSSGAPVLVGGIGVFFPGPDGYATFEQNFQPGSAQSGARTNAPKVLESEWIAYAALGGSSGAQPFNDVPTRVGNLGTITPVPPVPNIDLPFGRIDLVGISLELYGPHPTQQRPHSGIQTLVEVGQSVGQAVDATSGDNQAITPGPDLDPLTSADNVFLRQGEPVPEGWLVLPHDSLVDPITTADVEQIIANGIAEANLVRAAIRLPIGSRTRMVFAVADTTGEVLGLYRMPDATVFSIDVAVAKARNMAYFADPTSLQDIDRVDANGDNIPDPNIPAGAAFSNRTFRFLSEATFPDGVNGNPGPYSILNHPSINPFTGDNIGAPAPASSFTGVQAFDAFNAGRNMHDPNNLANQNGTVFFPGSTPLYKTIAGESVLIGGLGVSGDGVDQDDNVTFAAQQGFAPPQSLRADMFFVRGVRLPFQKFLRNPHG